MSLFPLFISRENSNAKRYTHPNVHCSTICNSQDMEATSIHKWMEKEDAVHIYNGISLSYKSNEIMPFAATLVDVMLTWDYHVKWSKSGLPLWLSWWKNPPAMWETWVWSMGWEDPQEKRKATHSSILAWRIPWDCIVQEVAKSWTRLSDFHF